MSYSDYISLFLDQFGSRSPNCFLSFDHYPVIPTWPERFCRVRSAAFPDCYLAMDGSGVTEATEFGTGRVYIERRNGTDTLSMNTLFRFEAQGFDGRFALAAVAYPNCYLHVNKDATSRLACQCGVSQAGLLWIAPCDPVSPKDYLVFRGTDYAFRYLTLCGDPASSYVNVTNSLSAAAKH